MGIYVTETVKGKGEMCLRWGVGLWERLVHYISFTLKLTGLKVIVLIHVWL